MSGPGKSPPRTHVQSQQRAFGKYTLIARLAVGGMAEIFLARLEGVGGFRKQVVIKRIRSALADDPSGDRLDAVLCLVQAAWASRQAQFGQPPRADALEGWIVSA